MTWVAGIDGCRGGWVVALREAGSDDFSIRVVETISDVWKHKIRPSIVCIDVPIGLLDHAAEGGRECDKMARKLLGQPRGRSVFSPPARPTVKARDFEDAVRRNRATSDSAIGISLQTYGILPKIREVDKFMTPQRQRTVVEVHPELVFHALNRNKPVVESKKSKAGLARRIRILERVYGRGLSELVEKHRSSKVARDDIIDAMAACWTAERVFKKQAKRVPDKPVRDRRGLRMEIVV